MKKFAFALCLGVASFSIQTGIAFADADDAKWIKQCVSDNAGEGQTAETVASYCSCMNNKMPSSATQSISTWEKTHTTEQEACSKESKWQSK